MDAASFSATCAETQALDLARIFHARRALEHALDHGTALLAALGLPRIVIAGNSGIDPEVVGAHLDAAIALLDAIDSPDEDLEPWLAGSPGPYSVDAEDDSYDNEEDDPGEDNGDVESSLGSLDGYVDQQSWSAGGTHELEDGDDNGVADLDGYHEQCGAALGLTLPWSVGGYVA